MLALRNVSISLNGLPLLRSFSLEIAAGEIVTLMGASGSGKSSLLDFIGGGLAPPLAGEGEILLDGLTLTARRPELRRIGRLFQDDYLFPHMSVGENLLFAIPSGNSEERRAAMEQALADCGLAGFAARPPHSLSGGQRARVALMRALLARPAAILLDEPFSKLDRPLRAAVRSFTFAHVRSRMIPALLVSHDADDVPPAGRVASILEDGVITHV